MSDPTQVNAQVENAIQTVSKNVLAPNMIKAEGAGKAYQSVAQSMAIAIQDATDNMRNINTMTSTAVGVAMAQLLATGEPKYAEVITQAQSITQNSIQTFNTIGSDASTILQNFPSS